MLLYKEARAKLCNPQKAIIIGMDGLEQSLRFCPIKFPTSAALAQSESGLIVFPS